MSDPAITVPTVVLYDPTFRLKEKFRTGARFLVYFFCLYMVVFATGQAQADLILSVEVNPDPVRTGDRLRSEITVTNTNVSDLNNVVLQVQVPVGVNTILPSLISGGGTCVGNGCDPGEQVTMSVTIESRIDDPLDDLTAILSSTTPGVTIHNGYVGYPTLPARGTASSNAPHFTLSIDASACTTVIDSTPSDV